MSSSSAFPPRVSTPAPPHPPATGSKPITQYLSLPSSLPMSHNTSTGLAAMPASPIVASPHFSGKDDKIQSKELADGNGLTEKLKVEMAGYSYYVTYPILC
ncbi:hypothetical protein EDB89DRAFT_2231665, partial [Lactarius sanguifluus]